MKKIFGLILFLLLAACEKQIIETSEVIIGTEKTEVIFEESEKASINVEYMQFADKILNTKIENLFALSLADFKKLAEESKEEAGASFFDWKFDASVEKISENDSQISLLYTEYQFTGGAHGNTNFSTLVYDKKSKKSKTLKDFLPNTDQALKTFSQTVQELLLGKIESADADWIADGAGPDFENFQNFVITETGDYQIYFPEYQVGPYVEGSQIVTVRKSHLDI